MSAENFAEQGGGRRNPVGFRGRQRNYAEFNATDVKGFYLRIVLITLLPDLMIICLKSAGFRSSIMRAHFNINAAPEIYFLRLLLYCCNAKIKNKPK